MSTSTAALLRTTLEASVPLWIDQIVRERWNLDRIAEEARLCSQTIAEHGDDILYRSKRKGGTASAFNALARGLACASFAPGGVAFAGLKFEADAQRLPPRDAIAPSTRGVEGRLATDNAKKERNLMATRSKKIEKTGAASRSETPAAAIDLKTIDRARLELRYLESRSPTNRQMAELLGAEPLVDHVAQVLIAAKAAALAEESAKRALVARATSIYFTQESSGQPFDTVRWRGQERPLGVEVAFTDQTKALPTSAVEQARAALGDELLANFAREELILELEGAIAGWAVTTALGCPADTRPYDGRSSVELRGPIARDVLPRIQDAAAREDVRIATAWKLIPEFDQVRRRLLTRLTAEQVEAVQKLRVAGCASPRVSIVKEGTAASGEPAPRPGL